MEAITFRQCVKGAWRDGWRYVRHRPALVAAMFAMAWLAPFAETALRPDRIPPFRVVTWIPLGMFELAETVLFSLLTVQAVRFVLLDSREADAEPLFGRNYWRYLGLACVLYLFIAFVAVLGLALWAAVAFALTKHQPDLSSLVRIAKGPSILLIIGIAFFIWLRFSLLSTHVAIGGAVRVRATWSDTRGHCWSLLLTSMVAALPMMVVSGAMALGEVAARQHGLGGVDAFGRAIANVGTFCISAACSAWLYRRYAVRLAAKA